MVFVHDISPELLSIGPLTIRWYGLLFALGLALNYLFTRWIFKREKYPVEHLDSVAVYLLFGLVIGARLGHVFFYEASYYMSNPLEILKIWHGGLSSHGATIGLFVAYLIWTRVHRIKFTKYPDALVLGIPLTATFVRVGNFFNSEIVGNFTNSDFGVVFKQLGEETPRHPAQLYEAFLSLFIFVALFFVYKKYYKKAPKLFFLFLYLLLYFAGRFVIEFWKDLHAMPEWFPLSMGQVLSILPILVAVIYFIFSFHKRKI
jgi:prolipoprotein diacylglyceryl transferase